MENSKPVCKVCKKPAVIRELVNSEKYPSHEKAIKSKKCYYEYYCNNHPPEFVVGRTIGAVK